MILPVIASRSPDVARHQSHLGHLEYSIVTPGVTLHHLELFRVSADRGNVYLGRIERSPQPLQKPADPLGLPSDSIDLERVVVDVLDRRPVGPQNDPTERSKRFSVHPNVLQRGVRVCRFQRVHVTTFLKLRRDQYPRRLCRTQGQS